MEVLYLKMAERGLTTFIKGKRFFVDNRSLNDLNKEGIAFCEVSKEFKSYGFLTGSYICPTESTSFAEFNKVHPCNANQVKEVYEYRKCIFYIIDDSRSDGGRSVYYLLKGMNKEKMLTSSCNGKATATNDSIIRLIRTKGKCITDEYMIDRAEPLKDLLDKGDIDSFMELFCSIGYSRIKKVLLLSDGKTLEITYGGSFDGTDQLALIKIGLEYTSYTYLYSRSHNLPTTNSVDITKQIHNYIINHSISYWEEPDSAAMGTAVRANFLNSSKKLTTMPRSNFSRENWEKCKDEILSSRKEYEEWISGLKRYVTTKNVKNFRDVQLDKVLWEVG